MRSHKMTNFSHRLRLFGNIQDLQKEAASMGLSRTASALEVTAAVAMEELSDVHPGQMQPPAADDDSEESGASS